MSAVTSLELSLHRCFTSVLLFDSGHSPVHALKPNELPMNRSEPACGEAGSSRSDLHEHQHVKSPPMMGGNHVYHIELRVLTAQLPW